MDLHGRIAAAAAATDTLTNEQARELLLGETDGIQLPDWLGK
jgi:hypothetical protein